MKNRQIVPAIEPVTQASDCAEHTNVRTRFLLVGLAVMALCGCHPRPGQVVPVTSLKDSSGAPIESRSLNGKVVVFIFSGIGCAGCEQFAPTVKQVSDNSPSDKVVVFDCNIWDDTASGAKELEGHSGVPAVQGGTALYHWAGMHVIPSYIVIDRQGRLSAAVDGVHTSDQLFDDLKAALLQQ